MNLARQPCPFQVSRRFTGQVFDSESGLYHYKARYYDPEIGRFIQPDSVISEMSNPKSYNRYSYCLNDPLTLNDPTGHGQYIPAPGDGQWGFVSGPYAYLTANSTFGQLGASVYNTIPPVDNSVYQVMRPVNPAFDAAGNFVHDVTLLVTGDPQLAESAENLPLLAGGTVGAVGKVEGAVAATEKATTVTTKIADEAFVVRGGKNLPEKHCHRHTSVRSNWNISRKRRGKISGTVVSQHTSWTGGGYYCWERSRSRWRRCAD